MGTQPAGIAQLAPLSSASAPSQTRFFSGGGGSRGNWIYGSSYNSRSQAAIETVHSVLNAYLRSKFLERKAFSESWGPDVMKMQWVYRTARTSILAPNGAGPSAYEMLFGFSPRLGSSATTCTDAFWARFWSERLEKLRQLNDEVLEQWKEQQRETTPSRKVAAGTIVYVKRQHVDRELATNTGEKTHISRRLQPLADGPFVLVVKDIGAALQVRSLAPPPASAGADTGDGAREKDNKASTVHKRRAFMF